MTNNKTFNNLSLLIDLGINEFLDSSPKKYYINDDNDDADKLSEVREIKTSSLDSIKNLSELKDAITNFNDCRLKNNSTNTVFADGNSQSEIMIIGDAPSKKDDIKGIPFADQAGQLLDKMLTSINLNRTNVYIANIIPWTTPRDRPPTMQEIIMLIPFIQKHIEIIRPKILILLGNMSTKSLLMSDDGIMKLRGKWHEYSSYGLANPIKTRAMFHPNFLLKSPSYKKLAWEDLLIIQKKLKSN